MVSYEGENCDQAVPPDDVMRKRVIPVTHDESTFWANDDVNRRWIARNRNPRKKKDRGGSQMVSAMLTEDHGLLCVNSNWQCSLTEEQVEQKFQARVHELKTSTDVRIKLLLYLLARGMKWTGSSMVVFLTQGVDALIDFLNEGGHEPTHDLDVYRTSMMDLRMTSKRPPSEGWEVKSFRPYKILDKIRLQHSDGTVVDIDQVNRVDNTLDVGTDLGNVHIAMEPVVGGNSRHRKVCYSTFEDPSEIEGGGPPALLTMTNMLTWTENKLDCHVLRFDIMPLISPVTHIPISQTSETDLDGRFRRKLRTRSESTSGRMPVLKLIKSYPVMRIIRPGANQEGYWDVEDQLLQLDHALDVFERRFGPEAVGLWLFDQSSNHVAYADNALNVHKLRWKDTCNAKDRPPPSVPGWFMRLDENGVLVKVRHEMNWNNKGTTMRKGMQTLIRERGDGHLLHKKGFTMRCTTCTEERSRGFNGKVQFVIMFCIDGVLHVLFM